MSATTRYATLPNGRRIHYTLTEDGSKVFVGFVAGGNVGYYNRDRFPEKLTPSTVVATLTEGN